MSLCLNVLTEIPQVVIVRDLSDVVRSRALVVFANGREFLVIYEQRSRMFEVTHLFHDGKYDGTMMNPFDTIGEVITYLELKSVQVFEQQYSILPFKFA